MELAAALPAHATVAMLIMQSLCQTLPKGSKILVLEAHQGVGYLCLQLARHLRPGAAGTRDLWTVAQCPLHVREAENICREAGAMDVLRDDPLPVIHSIHEGSFDVVIDTVGGRRRGLQLPSSPAATRSLILESFPQSTTPRAASCITLAASLRLSATRSPTRMRPGTTTRRRSGRSVVRSLRRTRRP